MTSLLKKEGLKLELLRDIDMVLMVEKGIRGGICHTIHRYAKANNKYMKNYDNNMESSYLMYLDANNLYGQTVSQKLTVNGFEWVEELSQFNEDFIKDYDDNCDEGYFLEVDVEYPNNMFSLHDDLPFLPERNKIKKCNNLVCNIHDKENCAVHIRALKQALNCGLILNKIHRVIEFNQEAWLKPYIDMNTKLRTEAKNDFFKVMNNAAVFGKTMENVRKHRDIKLVTTDKRRNQLTSTPNYHISKYFSEHLNAIEMKKTKVKTNNLVNLGMSILDISKTLMYESWYDYIKPKHGDRAKLCYMLFILKLKIFTKTLLMMLKNGLTHLTMIVIDCFQQARTKR